MASSDMSSGDDGTGSQISGSSFGAASKINPGQDDVDTFEETQALQTGLFGVLYTVSKEKDQVPIALVVFRLFFDVLQLWLLMVNPQYGFNINKDNLLWKIVSFVQLNDFMSSRGYTFFLGALYIFIILLAFDVGLCLWVGQAFRANRFDMVWPIVWLRYFSLVFFQVLDVASMTLFLMALDCRYFSVDENMQYTNQEFGVECFSGQHVVHAGLATVALVVFTTLAATFQMGEMELNLLTRNYLAMGHSKVEVMGFMMKFVMTCASVFLVSLKWYAVVQVVFATWMVYVYLKWEPQYYDVVNYVRVGSYTLVWYCSVLLVFMAFLPGVDESDDDAVDKYKKSVTIAMWAGIVPFFGLGWLCSYLRLRYLQVTVLTRFKHASPGTKYVKIFKFTDAREVELLARCCRKWVDVDELDPEAVALAELVMRAGLQQLPKDCYMVILYSSFLIDVQTSYQSGYSQLQAAKKLDPSLLEHFAIYSREQQHTQKAAGANAGTATDLVSYVEFQRNYRLALKVHREALLSIRGFWQSLLHSAVKFEGLAAEVIKIDTSVRAAEKTYRMVLQRHSTNVKIVRMYAKFLESCKEDPWGASKWFAEADRLEQQDEESKNNNMLDGFVLGDGGLPTSAADNHGVIISNAQGVMQITNAAICDMLGYARTELKSRSVASIMPSPIRENHAKIMRHYIATGNEVKMSRHLEQVVLHKEGHIVPVRIVVTRISGIGEDSMFMGLFEVMPRPPDTANVWVLAATGTVISVDEPFMDWTGFKVEETTNMPLSAVVVPNPELADALKEAKTAALSMVTKTSPVTDDAKGVDRSAPSILAVAENFRNAAAVAAAKAQARTTPLPMPVAEGMEDRDRDSWDPPPPSAFANPKVAGAAAGRNLRQNASLQSEGYLNEDQILRLESQALTGAASLTPARPVPPSMMHQTSGKGSPRLGARLASGAASLLGKPPQQASQLPTRSSLPTALDVPGAKKASAQASAEQEWKVRGVQVMHKYINTIDADVTITNGGSGAYSFHVLTLRRPARRGLSMESTLDEALKAMPIIPPGFMHRAEAHMLVCDRKGKVLHATQALCTRLGTSKKALVANGSNHALDAILPQPLAQMHRPLILSGPPGTVPPSYSCRTGMSVPLMARGPGGAEMVPFRILSTKREVPGTTDVMHVISLEEVTTEQALADRKLRLRVNGRGVITHVLGQPSANLFGFEPAAMVNGSIADYIDVFQPSGNQQDQHYTAKLLAEVVRRAADTPGMSYRVGVITPVEDVEDDASFDAMDAAFSNSDTCPAIMTVTIVDKNNLHTHSHLNVHDAAGLPVKNGQLAGSGLVVAPVSQPGKRQSKKNACLEIELWRADITTSVIELDSSGYVVQNQLLPCCPPGHILGVPTQVMMGQHLSSYLPLNGPVSALFQPPAPDGMVQDHERRAAKRSNLRSSTAASDGEGYKRAGPVHMFRTQHVVDGLDLDVAVQATRRNGMGGGYYVIMHVLAPQSGRSDFADWLVHGKSRVRGTRAGRLKRDPSGKLHRASMMLDQKQVAAGMHLSGSLTNMTVLETASGSAAGQRLLPQPPDLAALAAPMPSAVRRHSQTHSANAPLLDEEGIMALQQGDSPHAGAARKATFQSEDNNNPTGQAPARTQMGPKDPDASDEGSSAGGATEVSKDRVRSWILGTNGNAEGKPANGINISYQSLNGFEGKAPAARAEERDDDSAGAGGGDEGGDEYGNGPLKHRLSGRANGSDDEGGGGGGDDDSDDEGLVGHHHQHKRGVDEANDSSHDEKTSELDEAMAQGLGSGDFKRGQRFKKLNRMIGSNQAHRRMVRFKWQVICTVLFVMVVHCVCFAVMIMLLEVQKGNVAGLNTSGMVARLAGQVAVYTRSLHMLYNNDSYPWLPHLTSEDDIPWISHWLDHAIFDMSTLHTQVYMDLGGSAITDKYGMNTLWNRATINASIYYDVTVNQTEDPFQLPSQLTQRYELRSLWDLGNLITAQARDLQSHAELYVKTLNRSLANMSQYKIIMDNAGKSFVTAYLTHMDDMVQLVVDAANQVNGVQLTILVLEGVVLTVLAATSIWLISSYVAKHRYYVYSVFVALPQPLVRTLATKRLNLDDDSDDEDDIADPMVKQALDQQEGMLTEKHLQAANTGGAPKAAAKGISFGVGVDGAPSVGVGSVKFAAGAGPVAAAAPELAGEMSGHQSTRTQALMSKLRASLSIFTFKKATIQPPGQKKKHHGSRRRLQKSVWSAVQFTWLFVAWGVMIIIIDLLAHNMLGDISSPIATFNLVNFLMVRVFRTLIYITDICFSETVAEAAAARYAIATGSLEKEYLAALYGGSVLPNETSPHYTLAKTGITQAGGQGVHILYNTEECLCTEPIDCHTNTTDYFYMITHRGLDRLIQELSRIRATVVQMGGLDPYVYGPEFAWIWNTHRDIVGGLEMLNSAYHSHVVSVYQSVESIHIVGFVLTCIMLLGLLLFVLRPFMKNTANENRRIAELLSQLPAEIDVETLVQKALLKGMGMPSAAAAAVAATGPPEARPGPSVTASRGRLGSSVFKGVPVVEHVELEEV